MGEGPVLLTRERVTVLVACILVALGSGTNYVFSAYAPQLGSRLGINHTKLNLIGLGGNIGVYTTAPIFGRIADKRGPKGLLLVGFVSLLIGYLGIRAFYNAGAPDEGELPAWKLYALIVCSFITGVGGNAGLCAGLNTAAKSFPDRSRGTANGLVLSGFGLSAFFFSTLAHLFFHDDTSAFLLILGLGTAAPMLLGLWIVRPVPPSLELALAHGKKHSQVNRPSTRRDDSSTRLLSRTSLERRSVDAEEAEVSRSRVRAVTSDPLHMGELADVAGKDLWRYPDFWLLFSIMSLLSGTGLMYINNVGSISQALYSAGTEVVDPKHAAQWQAAQVSTVSIGNCLGRIIIGMTADFVHNTLALRRAYCLSLVSSLFLISQLSLLMADAVEPLWHTSALLGLAYGSLFGLCPTISGEWFGLSHFSENWGFLSLSPLFGGNAFSIAFGRDIDAHAPATVPPTPVPSPGNSSALPRLTSLTRRILHPRGGMGSDVQCLLGPACYRSSVQMTVAATTLALALSIWAGIRDRRKALAQEEEIEGILFEGED